MLSMLKLSGHVKGDFELTKRHCIHINTTHSTDTTNTTTTTATTRTTTSSTTKAKGFKPKYSKNVEKDVKLN